MYFAGLAEESFGEGPKGQRPKDHDIPNGLWRRKPSSYHGGGDWPSFHMCILCCTIYLGTHRQVPVYSKGLMLV